MIRSIVFDMDGMVVRHDRLSDRLVSDYGIPMEKLLPFFTGDFQKCLIGELDLKEVLPRHFSDWGWQGSVDDLLDVWFDPKHSIIDTRFERLVSQLLRAKVKSYLATNNERYRTENLIHRGLGSSFDEIFSSAFLGCKKPDPEFFRKIAGLIGESQDSILFCDDDEENLSEAEKSGFMTYRYTDFETFEKFLETRISRH